MQKKMDSEGKTSTEGEEKSSIQKANNCVLAKKLKKYADAHETRIVKRLPGRLRFRGKTSTGGVAKSSNCSMRGTPKGLGQKSF